MKVEKVRLGEILELQRRLVDVDPVRDYTEVGLRSFGKGIFHKEPMPGISLGDKRVFAIRAGDLLVSNVFGWEGAIAVARAPEVGLVGSHRFMTWTPRTSGADVDYLAHFLLSDDGMEALRRASPGSAGRNRTLSIKNLESIQVPLPPIGQQRRIAVRLERFGQAARSLVGGRVPLNALEVVAADREWTLPMSELIEVDVDEFEVAPGAIYARAGVLSAGRGLFSQGELEGRNTKYRRLRRIRTDQVVLSRLTAFIGGVALVGPGFDGFVLSQEYPTFSLRPGVPPNYVQSLLASSSVRHQLRAASTGVGNTRQRVSSEAFLTMKIPRLTAVEQQRVAHRHRLISRHDELTSHRSNLAGALLPAARNEVFSQFR